MRRMLVVVSLLLVLAPGAARPAAPADHLRIVVWPQGTGQAPLPTRTLTCRPAGGTLKRPVAACAKLTLLGGPFGPPPPGLGCSNVVSGPQKALVTGTFEGRRIWARFSRTDSCQTWRWNRIAFLFVTR